MNPEALLQADRTARAEALDVGRSFIVQAPAGSGKTELLIQRYLRLLAVVEEPEEILAITFTRKAAAEMRLRILEALQCAQRAETPPEPHRRLTADAAAAALDRDAELGWQLITNSGRMRIQTIDALNASLARMQPLTQGSASSTNAVADDSTLNALYAEAAAATFDWLGDGGSDDAAIAEVLLHVDNNTGRYVDYLSRMLKTRDQWLPFVSTGITSEAGAQALRARFELSLQRVVADRLRRLFRSAPGAAAAEIPALGAYAAANLVADDKSHDPICAIGDLARLPGDASLGSPAAIAAAARQWLGVAELLLTKAGSVRKQVNRNQGFPPRDAGQKQAMTELLGNCSDEFEFAARLHDVRALPPLSYTDEQWSVLRALFRVLGVAVAEFIRLCRSRGVTDHIEIAMSAAKALGSAEEPGDLALLLDYQIRHILVDEMQDTSTAQYRMLETLTAGWQAGDGRTLFCVGDPMQSIYRFRNAEVAQFLLAREKGIAALQLEPLLLRRNFRSGERLVDWYNAVFQDVLPRADDPIEGAVAYAPSIAVRERAGSGEYHVYPLFGGSVAAEADTGRDVVRRIQSQHERDSIAVLVRGRTQLPQLLARLRGAGIAYRAVDIDRLADLPEIIDILALTRAFAHYGDRVAWLALLRSPWVGLDWSDLHRLVSGAPRAAVLELLQDENRRVRLSDFGAAAVERFLESLQALLVADRSGALHRRVERAWFALGGPALAQDDNAVANVYHFLDALARLEAGGSIADIAELARQLDEIHVSSSKEAQVQIMTMHKAKGLQFDHVILYGLGRASGSSRKSVLSWFDIPDEHGNEDKIISPVGREDELENDPLHQFIERTKSAKDAHENARLLYVACTRARKSLHLVGNVGLSPDASTYRPPHSGSLLKLLWPALEPHYAEAFESAGSSGGDDEDEVFVAPPLRRFASPWRLPPVADLARPARRPSAAGDAHPVDYDWVGFDARLAGTLVHRWLQLAAEGRIILTRESIGNSRPRSMRWLSELGASDVHLESICERVEAALRRTIDDDKGRWLLAGKGAAELALTGEIAGRIETISIDRLLIDDDGTHWIVDYKTSSHEGGGLDEFLQAESDRYREQLRKYAEMYRGYSGEMARCALYFPLLQRFVEVPV